MQGVNGTRRFIEIGASHIDVIWVLQVIPGAGAGEGKNFTRVFMLLYGSSGGEAGADDPQAGLHIYLHQLQLETPLVNKREARIQGDVG